jgi:hypothetical protein
VGGFWRYLRADFGGFVGISKTDFGIFQKG